MYRIGFFSPRFGVAAMTLALGAMVFAAGPAASAGAQPSTPPHIVLTPNNVMVNQTVSVRGTGFPRDASLRLEECSLTRWVVTQNPCLSNNAVTVSTNRAGAFETTMKAEICPAVSPPQGTQRTCYVGVPRPSGIDTVRLEGAARLVVSWP
jgi:hypothetical protein